MKECYMQCGVLKSNEDMILALAGQFKQLSHEPEKCIVTVSWDPSFIVRCLGNPASSG